MNPTQTDTIDDTSNTTLDTTLDTSLNTTRNSDNSSDTQEASSSEERSNHAEEENQAGCPFHSSSPFDSSKSDTVEKATDSITNTSIVQGVRKNVESALQYTLSKFVRPVANSLSYRVINTLKPVKMYAYKTRFPIVKRTILEVTTPIDFAMIWLNIQNETMELHEKAYGGNFLFGKSVMVTGYSKTASEIVKPSFRSNDFMGVNIVSSASDVFATNTGILNQNPPIRQSTRQYMDDHIFTPHVLAYDYATVSQQCQSMLDEWVEDPDMTSTFKIRGTVTRLFLMLLADVSVTKEDADETTTAYMRRFVEYSLLNRYFPVLTGVLGTREHIRKDVYVKLRRYDIDNMIIDITLFAAMFSVGTLIIRCIENIQRYGIKYSELDPQQRRHFVIESVRLYPTVTTVHRMLQEDENIEVCDQILKLTSGDQIAYPFICSNQDPNTFSEPEQLIVDRPEKEYEKILSWSKGDHECPAKELSILVTMVMLDRLAIEKDLSSLRIFNPAF